MTGDWKTLRVPTGAYKEAKQQKEKQDRTWGEQLVCSNNSTTEYGNVEDIVASIQNMRDEIMANISAECGDVANTEDMQDVATKLSKLTDVVEDFHQSDEGVVVETVEVETQESGVDVNDVENIVERWMEKNYQDLQSGVYNG